LPRDGLSLWIVQSGPLRSLSVWYTLTTTTVGIYTGSALPVSGFLLSRKSRSSRLRIVSGNLTARARRPFGADPAKVIILSCCYKIQRDPYYYSDDIYYRPGPSGYVVVPAPAAAAVVTAPNITQPGATSGEAVVINIPNTNGGYTPVQLTKHKEGYVGPQGEYYEHPTVKQLKVLYGR